jgi:hypothetical protein
LKWLGHNSFALTNSSNWVSAQVQDPPVVIADPHARYFGTELGERTLVPGTDAMLGEIRFEDWLAQSAVHAVKA